MELKLPKFLTEIIDSTKIEDVLVFLKEMVVFYIVPKRFFRNFYSKSPQLQIRQTIFYTLIVVTISWLLIEKSEARDSYKFILSIFLITIPFTLINALSRAILRVPKFNIGKTGLFVYLIWILLSIPVLILLILHASTENYVFLFAANLINTIAFVYSLFLIWHIHFESVTRIILGYALNILIVNILFFVFILSFFDSYSTETLQDPLIAELNMHLQNLKNFKTEGTPSILVQETDLNTNVKTYQIGFIDESLVYVNVDSLLVYKQMAGENAKYLDSIIPVLKFKRNKDILLSFLDYNKNINKLFLDTTCTTCLTEHTIYRKVDDSLVAFDRQEYRIDKYTQPLKEFRKKITELSENLKIAYFPGRINYFVLQPGILLARFIGLKKEINTRIQF